MNKIILGVTISVVASLTLAATGWNFKATAEMSDRYVSKEDQRVFVERNDKEHQRIVDKLDKIIDYLLEESNE